MVEGAGIEIQSSMEAFHAIQVSNFKFQGVLCSVLCALASVAVVCAEMSSGVSLTTSEMLKLMLQELASCAFSLPACFPPSSALPPFASLCNTGVCIVLHCN
jgi:hypothetical protein